MKTIKYAFALAFALPVMLVEKVAAQQQAPATEAVATSVKNDGLLASNDIAKYSYLLPNAAAPSDNGPQTKKSMRTAARLNKANYKALRDFKQDYQDGNDVKWINGTNAITATFNRDNVLTSVVYDKAGHRAHVMNIYMEDKMPAFLKKQVRQSDYYNHQIKVIQQIQEMNKQFFIVHLEDSKNYTQLAAYDGNLDVYRVASKQ